MFIIRKKKQIIFFPKAADMLNLSQEHDQSNLTLKACHSISFFPLNKLQLKRSEFGRRFLVSVSEWHCVGQNGDALTEDLVDKLNSPVLADVLLWLSASCFQLWEMIMKLFCLVLASVFFEPNFIGESFVFKIVNKYKITIM